MGIFLPLAVNAGVEFINQPGGHMNAHDAREKYLAYMFKMEYSSSALVGLSLKLKKARACFLSMSQFI